MFGYAVCETTNKNPTYGRKCRQSHRELQGSPYFLLDQTQTRNKRIQDPRNLEIMEMNVIQRVNNQLSVGRNTSPDANNDEEPFERTKKDWVVQFLKILDDFSTEEEWSRSMEENGSLSPEVVKTETLGRGESGDCGPRGRDIALHMAVLEAKLSDEAHAKTRLSLAVSEYEKRMLEKERQIETLRLEKQDVEFECHGLKQQLEVTTKHLDTIEISFNDVHEKYERAKQTIQILLQNVETLKDSLAEHDLCISQKHDQFQKLKEHAMERMDFANSQLDLIERKYSLETSKLRAAVKEAELGARSLSEQLEQRNRDNAELTSICDGLIEKLDSQNDAVSENGPIHSDMISKLEF